MMLGVLRAKDVMQELGVSKTRAHEIIRQNEHLKFARSVRIRVETFAAWRARQPYEPAPLSLRKLDAPAAPGVYAIASGRFVKIGKSDNIRLRLAQLQTAHAEELALVAVLSERADDEPEFHARLALHRHRGEWFRIEGRVIDVLREAGALT